MDKQLTGNVRLELADKGFSKFWFNIEGTQAGEMIISISRDILTVYHTEVRAEYEGKGIAARLLDAMVAYVRAHHLKAYPLCPYVQAQFRRYLDRYNDIWLKDTVH